MGALDRTGGMGRAIVAAAAIAAIWALSAAPAGAATQPCRAQAPNGGDWPSYGHDAANTRNQPDETQLTPAVASGLAPAWIFSTSAGGDATSFQSTPVIAGGCAFVGSTGGSAYAIDTSTGQPVW